MLGSVGQFSLILGFIACGLSAVAYYLSTRRAPEAETWKQLGRGSWMVMLGTVGITSAILLYLLLTHQFQYAYVYQYSSRGLPFHFLLSTFWAGQEGSFLLWILFVSLIGVVVSRTSRSYESPVMTIIAVSQLFLLSMIVGIRIGAFTLGSNLFASLPERFPDAPIFQQQPGFVPADGNGLNDLLQNFWMVIHPPTLFVGFAVMVVPFAYAIAGLWQKRYTEWVKPALPWALFASMILGFGIALGGYWAYVTLSFGGYWAWDPVENSSFVPWLIGVAGIHTMIVQKKSGSSHKAAFFLNIAAYVLVIYSTFLTRSGILGDLSVHSFVDLGLHNQLLLWILTVLITGFGLFAYRYRELPRPEREPSFLSREFMIFSGAMLLCAMAAVILLGTSAPILGRIFRDSPSAVPVAFYNKWSLPIAVTFVFLAGLGQLFWWHKMSVEHVNRVLLKPLLLAVASTILVLVLTPFAAKTVQIASASSGSVAGLAAGFMDGLGRIAGTYGAGILMLLLLFASFFAFYGNGLVLWRIGRGNLKLAGGATAHIGMVLCVIGIISSAGFSNPLTDGDSTSPGENRNNFVINRGETRSVQDYRFTYAGQEITPENHTAYVLNVTDPHGRTFTLKPVVYKSEKEQWIQHPDLKLFFEKDIYAAVSPNIMFGSNQETNGDNGQQFRLAMNDSTVLGNGAYSVRFTGFDTQVNPELLPKDSIEIAVAAVLDVRNTATGQTQTIRPIYVIMRDRSVRYLPMRADEGNLVVGFTGMDVDSGQISLQIQGAEVREEDWLVVQAYEKPFINVLWIGILLLTGGFVISMYRRIRDLAFRPAVS